VASTQAKECNAASTFINREWLLSNLLI
jgi:hypothetical protein